MVLIIAVNAPAATASTNAGGPQLNRSSARTLWTTFTRNTD